MGRDRQLMHNGIDHFRDPLDFGLVAETIKGSLPRVGVAVHPRIPKKNTIEPTS